MLIRTKTIHCYEMFLLKGQRAVDGDGDVVDIHEPDSPENHYSGLFRGFLYRLFFRTQHARFREEMDSGRD